MSNPTGSMTMAEQQTWSKLASLFPGPFVPFLPAPGAPPNTSLSCIPLVLRHSRRGATEQKATTPPVGVDWDAVINPRPSARYR